MIIFDWDDTLLCTTYLGSLGFVDVDESVLDQIRPLDDSAVDFIFNLKYIIFNYFFLFEVYCFEYCKIIW